MKKIKITDAEILAKATPRGSWTRVQLAEWGVPWPPPHGWRRQIVECGYPYDPSLPAVSAMKVGAAEVSAESLSRMMAKSRPQIIDGAGFGVDGQLDIDPAKLLRKVVVAVINAGHASDLYEFPDVLAFFGARIPAKD